jgi:hypothetical protein
MCTFAEKQRLTREATPAESAIMRGRFAQSHVSERRLEAGSQDVKGNSPTETDRCGLDFSRIPVHAATPAPDRQAATGPWLAGQAQKPDGQSRDTFNFGTLRIFPIPAPMADARSSPAIPTADGAEQDVFDPPQKGGGGPAPAGPSPAGPTPADACAQPASMNKIVSGSFLGGLTMDSYYPDLSGRGFWAHAGAGGPFETSTQAGGNAQLFGVIPGPCDPSRFHLEQTASVARFRVGGAKQPLEGKTFDDIAQSGRDFTRAPARQDFLGGGVAPAGYIISMADPPSVNFGPSRPDVERDTDFVSSLVGPGGRQSVSWSQSVRVAGGVVTANTLA